jgi:hypothetical protein
MKQGRADSKKAVGQKVEPTVYIRDPAAVSYLGTIKGNHSTDGDVANPNFPTDYSRGGLNYGLGNGFSPNPPVTGWDGSGPGAGRVVRSKGSQGKY